MRLWGEIYQDWLYFCGSHWDTCFPTALLDFPLGWKPIHSGKLPFFFVTWEVFYTEVFGEAGFLPICTLFSSGFSPFMYWIAIGIHDFISFCHWPFLPFVYGLFFNFLLITFFWLPHSFFMNHVYSCLIALHLFLLFFTWYIYWPVLAAVFPSYVFFIFFI